MRALTLAALILAILGLIACGSGDKTDASTPEEAAEQLFDRIDKGQWRRHYSMLHPAHQALVSEERYVECADAIDKPRIDSVKVMEVYDENTTIPGTDITTASKAITVELKWSKGFLNDTVRDTLHLIDVDGQWRWALADPNEYTGDRCPE